MLFVLSVIWLIICSFSFFLLKDKRTGYFGPIQILLVLSIFDTAIPSILSSIYGFNQSVEWKNDLTQENLLNGIIVYIIFYIIMMIFYWLTNKLSGGGEIVRNLTINEKKFFFLSIIIIFLWVISLILQAQAAGGFSEYFIKKAIQRWSGELNENSNIFMSILNYFKWDFIINAITLLGLYNLRKFKFKIFWKYLLPSLCIVIAALTFFRGAILTVLVGFFFISNISETKVKFKLSIKNISIVAICILFFFVFSLSRDTINREQSNSEDIEDKASYFYNLFSQGSGIDGVSHIVHRYGEDCQFFYGKTYLDMLLLPVPRFIYPSKPDWYGIDDITRRMGWIESSQSAVTIPGEAFANFGWFCFFIAPFFGMFYARLNNFISVDSSPLFFIYPAIVINGVMVSNWMAFTGIANQFITFTIVYIILKLIIDKK